MIITKKPVRKDERRLPFWWFPRGRDAFEHVLRSPEGRGRKVLLPAYIGWGPVEGSGVFDPVESTRAPFEFYRMKGDLEIDAASAKRAIEANPGSLLLLIHYFGFRDRSVSRLKKLAREHDCRIVEDFAHGLFTFLRDPVVDFDWGVFSLHKMLPYPNLKGGLLVSAHPVKGAREYLGFHRYDLGGIARARRENYAAALERVQALGPPGLSVLRPDLRENVPESFPILLEHREMRDGVHRAMNEAGYGLISLYHQLIDRTDASFRTERRISDRITNLPIHQDANPRDVVRMVDALDRVLRKESWRR
jgi:dTDP-4-amino-4,6-dideoxygalactose transaminase